MNDEEKCGNCYFVRPIENDTRGGRCHFNPPQWIGEWMFPWVGYEISCGQWAPRRDETPPYPPPEIPDQKVATRVRRQRERVAPIADVDAEIEHENDPESER